MFLHLSSNPLFWTYERMGRNRDSPESLITSLVANVKNVFDCTSSFRICFCLAFYSKVSWLSTIVAFPNLVTISKSFTFGIKCGLFGFSFNFFNRFYFLQQFYFYCISSYNYPRAFQPHYGFIFIG